MSRRGCWDHRPELPAISRLQSWTTSNVQDVAMALAIGRERPGDWSPEALLWLYALADAYADVIHQNLVRAVLYAAARNGILASPDAVAAAVGDAMALVRRPGRRSCPTLRSRALALRMRAENFGLLRSTAEHLLLSVIRRGVTSYLCAYGYTDRGPESLAPTNRHTGNHGPETLAA